MYHGNINWIRVIIRIIMMLEVLMNMKKIGMQGVRFLQVRIEGKQKKHCVDIIILLELCVLVTSFSRVLHFYRACRKHQRMSEKGVCHQFFSKNYLQLEQNVKGTTNNNGMEGRLCVVVVELAETDDKNPDKRYPTGIEVLMPLFWRAWRKDLGLKMARFGVSGRKEEYLVAWKSLKIEWPKRTFSVLPRVLVLEICYKNADGERVNNNSLH